MHTPLIILYGIDANGPAFETESTYHLVHTANEALRERGWRTALGEVRHSLDDVLTQFDPRVWTVLNLCEGSPHQVHYYASVARELAHRGYTFTGSDHVSLDKTQFKRIMKRMLDDAHVPTPSWAIVDGDAPVAFDAFPAIVKPANEHCSYGITRDSVVLNRAEARRQSKWIKDNFHEPSLIEEFLDSAEYNVTVWGNQQPTVLGISTMLYDAFDDIHDRLCTFDAKWTPESDAYQKIPAICPAPISDALKQKIEAASLAGYIASGVRDYGRVDLRLRGDEPMVLDVNSNCDISNDGGFANAARAAGLSYGEMLERIVMIAIEREQSHARAQLHITV